MTIETKSGQHFVIGSNGNCLGSFHYKREAKKLVQYIADAAKFQIAEEQAVRNFNKMNPPRYF